ncbi:hypothetical protein SETIT_1G184400v2 [Setaria italica]|uniref:Hydrophobic seed protein domain-containing protein n=2 Tax=Setaria TaxID=4554 RepID=A0A368PM18_SETIT|nr:hypothetical protein SETIT_1G184400v2 [Setaria italica]TKW39578.1 hypothetical protein SEVIR_1G188200v2 [Setaria viridis]
MAPSKLALFLALSVLALARYYAPVPTPPSSGGSCPINVLKLEVCANVLNLLKLNIPILDAAVCLCTAIKAKILGIKLNVPIDLRLLLNHCGKVCPAYFTCPL